MHFPWHLSNSIIFPRSIPLSCFLAFILPRYVEISFLKKGFIKISFSDNTLVSWRTSALAISLVRMLGCAASLLKFISGGKLGSRKALMWANNSNVNIFGQWPLQYCEVMLLYINYIHLMASLGNLFGRLLHSLLVWALCPVSRGPSCSASTE